MLGRIGSWLLGALLFSMFGLCTEIVFTGLGEGFGGSFRGSVSLLMVPVYALAYALAGPLLAILDRLGWYSLAVRVPLTVLLIYTIEWSSGAFYRAHGLSPWHYAHGWASDFSGGNITLLYLPAWILFSLIVLRVYRIVRAVTPHVQQAARVELARGRPGGRSLPGVS